MIDLTGKDKAEVLRRLYNAASAQGIGVLNTTAGGMTLEKARELLASGKCYFDYLDGRVMKVDLSSDMLDERLYDRDNGFGAAASALKDL